jgi:MFS family permease
MGVLKLRGRPLYTLMKIICGVSFMMYGYDAGVLGGVLLHKPFLDAIGNPTGEYTIPLITSSYSLAACITSLIVSTFAFRIGRRGTVLLGNAVAIIGSAIQASSYSVAQLVVGRVCTGFAIGCISSAVPTYLTETGMEIGDRGPANALNAILLIGGGKGVASSRAPLEINI